MCVYDYVFEKLEHFLYHSWRKEQDPNNFSVVWVWKGLKSDIKCVLKISFHKILTVKLVLMQQKVGGFLIKLGVLQHFVEKQVIEKLAKIFYFFIAGKIYKNRIILWCCSLDLLPVDYIPIVCSAVPRLEWPVGKNNHSHRDVHGDYGNLYLSLVKYLTFSAILEKCFAFTVV